MCKNKLFFVLSIVILLLTWSSSYTAINLALKDFSPEGLALFRFLIASALLYILSFWQEVRIPDKNDLPLIFTCGVLGVTVCSIVLYYGQIATPVAVTSILLNTYPIFVALLSFIVFKEYIDIAKIVGIVIGFAGILIVSAGKLSGFSPNSSMLLLILAAVLISFYDIEQKQLLKKYSPFELTCYFVWIGTLFLLIFSKSLINDLQNINVSSLLPVAYLGAFPSVLAALIWGKLVLKYSITTLACCFYIMPFFAMLIAFIFLHQIPETSTIMGSLVIIIGLMVVNFSKKLSYVDTRIRKNM